MPATKKTEPTTAVNNRDKETIQSKSTESLVTTRKKLTDATKSWSTFVSAFSTGGRKVLEGVIEVDKALYGYAGETVKSYLDLGRNSVGAKSVNDLLDLHVAHGQIEKAAANTREVLDLARIKVKEACDPINEALSANTREKTTA